MVRTRKHSKDYSEGLPITRVIAVKTKRHAKVKIYSHLPMHQRVQSERLCRRFRNVLKNYAFRNVTKLEYRTMLLWKRHERLRGTKRPKITKGAIEQMFTRFGRYITEADVGGFRANLQGYILRWIKTCPKIRRLDLSYMNATRLNDSELLEIGRALPNLLDLNLSHTCCTKSALVEFCQTQTCLRALNLSYCGAGAVLKYLPSIEVLNISHWLELRNEHVLTLKDACPNLKELDISDNIYVGDRGLEFGGWKRLEILRFNQHNARVADNGFVTFNDMPAFTECHMSSNGRVNDQTVHTLCLAAPKLVVLNISAQRGFGPRLSDFAFAQLSRLRCLEFLNVGSVEELNEHHLLSIAANGRLKQLVIHYCRQIGNNAVLGLLDCCRELTLLRMRDTLVDLAVVPHLLAYADEFEYVDSLNVIGSTEHLSVRQLVHCLREGRPILEVTSEKEQLSELLNAHPKIKCTPYGAGFPSLGS